MPSVVCGHFFVPVCCVTHGPEYQCWAWDHSKYLECVVCHRQYDPDHESRPEAQR